MPLQFPPRIRLGAGSFREGLGVISGSAHAESISCRIDVTMADRAYDRPRREPRKSKTLFCQLACEGKHYPVVVLNVAPSGLFVRTAVALPHCKEVEVTLRVAGGQSWTLRAEIVRRPREGRFGDKMLKRGLGLRLIDPPDGFAEFVEGL